MAKIESVQPVPRAQVVLKSEEEVKDLLDDLRRCLRESRRTGGRYCTGVKDVDGEVVICVWVPGVAHKPRRV